MPSIRITCTVLLVLALAACTAAPPPPPVSATTVRRSSPSVQEVNSAFAALPVYDRLETFSTEGEFKAYLRRIEAVHRQYRVQRIPVTNMPPVLLAQQGEPCDPAVDECDELSEVVVTGTRITAQQSITNNQVAGVDEGDIVKSWGRFLVVLHDARLFTVDLGEAHGQMRLADRVDAYQDSSTDAWYDELLIYGNKVLVTGYSYDAGQTEVSIFDINARGRLKLAKRFFIQSADYFSGRNYASRLVGGKLVLYTPIELWDLMQDGMPKFPRIRSWTPKGGFTSWRALLTATDIYRPIDRALDQGINVISVCSILSGKATDCISTGILGARHRELYVSPEAAYLWTGVEVPQDHVWVGRQSCLESGVMAPAVRPATLYQLPFSGEPVTAVRTRGIPPDQFSMERRRTTFHALVHLLPTDCYLSTGRAPLQLVSFPVRDFSDMPRAVGASREHSMPAVGAGHLSARFAQSYLVYGAGAGWWRARLGREIPEDGRQLVTVPLAGSGSPQVHPLAHSVERVELLGENVVTFGMTADRELGLTTLDLRSVPRIASTHRIPDVVESEGRSHAFNSEVADDGSAVFGLPTATPSGEKDRWGYVKWRESVHFFTASSVLAVGAAGSLPGERLPDNPSYKCEVSCVDWYGNARPIFYRGRIFALLGREFVEGQLAGGTMQEVGRIDLTLPPQSGSVVP